MRGKEAERVRVQLCVIGGGLSGICAAIAAARRGVSVALVHDRPVLGGNASSEVKMWIRGASMTFPLMREGGILEEIAMRNTKFNPDMSYGIWDGVLYGMVVAEPNIRLFLNTSCMGAIQCGDRIESIEAWQLTTYRRYNIEADFFADCSGDCILSEFTDAECVAGRESKKQFGEAFAPDVADAYTMGASCILQARETSAAVPYTPLPFARKFAEKDFAHRLKLNDRTAFAKDNFWWIELGGQRDVLTDAQEINAELYAAVYGVWDFIKNSGKYDSVNWELDWVGALAGKRESRRYVGDYVLTQTDVQAGRIFGDEVAYGGWPLDDHDPLGMEAEGAPNRSVPLDEPYSIPYRSLYSKNIRNLYFAGRNISVTHIALSSSRVMATCALVGQAAGTACALALQKNTDARGVGNYMAELQQMLRDDDCYLLGTPRKLSEAMANSENNLPPEMFCRLLAGEERKTDQGESRIVLRKGQAAHFVFRQPVYCHKVRIVFDNDIAREFCNDFDLRMYPNKLHISASDLRAEISPRLVKDFEVSVLRQGVWVLLERERDNYLRLYTADVGEKIEGVRFVGLETYGADEISFMSLDVL